MEDISPQEQLPPQEAPDRTGEGSAGGSESKKPGSRAPGRKRTKTGCLTCRKRRIKCGEERPTCHNCTKSRRQCEGYNQRVIFKDPINIYRPSQASSSSHVSSSQLISSSRRGESSQKPLPPLGPLPIAPKPTVSSATTSDATARSTERTTYGFDVKQADTTATRLPLSHPASQSDNDPASINRAHLPGKSIETSPLDKSEHDDSNAPRNTEQGPRETVPVTSEQMNLVGWFEGPTTIATSYGSYQTLPDWPRASASSASSSAPFPSRGADGPALTAEDLVPKAEESSQKLYERAQFSAAEQLPSHEPPSQVASEYPEPVPAQWYPDEDDPYDVSDDDANEAEYGASGDWQVSYNNSHLRQHDLGIAVVLQAQQVGQDVHPRSFTSFIDRPDMLATYMPSPQSSPLNDSMTARIFCHFINVTGPSISMFERHPANPSLLFQGHPIPRSQQHIWTYTFPTLAFHNEALLHAILALASLHIAKLQNGHITASLKHYAMSLRRVAKSVNHPTRRGQPATLAAAMILGFYEAWSADHQKWSNHLLGAKMLMREIDFAGMTRAIKLLRLQQRRAEDERFSTALQHGLDSFTWDSIQYQRLNEDVDENIISMLMGKRVRYDQYGQILDDNATDSGGVRSYTQKELQDYETQRDLYWWYCKMDTYNSLLGGGRLFMAYERWNDCPPRAPLGRLNATYGTYDHLILLTGRVADFASKDMNRKRLAAKASGGWRPPDAARMPSQTGQHGPPTMPPFSGMIPGIGEAVPPMGFEESFRDQSPKSFQDEGADLEAMRIEAEEEWLDIMNAFSILEDHFGEDFQALGAEFSAPIETPFGPALQYRTYGIAGIWMTYYMSLIICHRCHPSMPPAAMMAVGIAARQTASFANEVGRIAAGISPDCGMISEVSPGVGAALIESTMGLFIAGVQYQNSAQRAWTINRLHDIARLTGWQSALSICNGCEASWVKAGEQGRGPPYTRVSKDDGQRRIDRAMLQMDSGSGRLVVREMDKAHYALGLLGVEEDFESLNVENDQDPK